MTSNQEIGPRAFTHPLQAEATEYYRSWEARHASNRAAGLITDVMPPEMVLPEHDINTGMVPVKQTSLELPPEVFMPALQQVLGQAMGSAENAASFVEDIKKAHTSPQNTTPLLTTLDIALKNDKNVAVLFGHQKLGDMGLGLVALIIARGKNDLQRNIVTLNKAKAFGMLEGRGFVDGLSDFSNVVFVSPITETSRELGIPKEIEGHVNFVGGRALKTLMRSGSLVAIALHGTSLKATEFKENESLVEGLKIPKMDYSSARLTEEFDYFLRMPIWFDKNTGEISWEVGPLEARFPFNGPRKDRVGREAHNKQVADKQQQALAVSLERLSGVRIVNEELLPAQKIGAQALAGSH